MMEPERPKVDWKVLDFVKSAAFDPADFVIRTDGVCRLNPEMKVSGTAGLRGTNSSMFASGISWRCGQNWSCLSKPAATRPGLSASGVQALDYDLAQAR
jgi:hypothetical protein